jgi:hypothetical protein
MQADSHRRERLLVYVYEWPQPPFEGRLNVAYPLASARRRIDFVTRRRHAAGPEAAAASLARLVADDGRRKRSGRRECGSGMPAGRRRKAFAQGRELTPSALRYRAFRLRRVAAEEPRLGDGEAAAARMPACVLKTLGKPGCSSARASPGRNSSSNHRRGGGRSGGRGSGSGHRWRFSCRCFGSRSGSFFASGFTRGSAPSETHHADDSGVS